MGSGGSGGSLKTVEAAILALSPWAVIMVGIAFGFDPVNQRIGDILISQQIQDYDLERVGSGPSKYPRGNRVSASASLLSNFITSQYYIFEDWPNPPKVHPGLILSGSKLVDDEDFRNQLHMIAPNAVGGEMEGVGLYEAALNKGVEWLLVKAISDWADGKKHVHKKEYQQLAAEHAARFTIKAIELGGFTRPQRR
jgi:nucleoside phosphorylase